MDTTVLLVNALVPMEAAFLTLTRRREKDRIYHAGPDAVEPADELGDEPDDDE